MKKIVLALSIFLVFSTSFAEKKDKFLIVELSESHFTLNIWQHIADANNKVQLRIPVADDFFEEVKVGDDLLASGKTFRTGSFIFEGEIGDWHLKVISKEE